MVEELEKHIAGLKTITLRAYLGKTQGKLTVRPVMSKRTGRLIGVTDFTEEQKRHQQKVIDAHTEKVIEDGLTINLEDPIDQIDWEWIKHCPEIEGDIEDCHSSKIALFYIENINKDTDIRIKKRKVKIQAFLYLQESSQTKKIEVCRLMGIDAISFSGRELEDYLGELADSNPKRLVDAFEDKLVKVKLFLYGLVDKRIISIDQDNVYRWGSYILGIAEKSALEWLQISDNASHVKRLHEILYPAPVSLTRNEGELAMPSKPLATKSEILSEPSEADMENARERYKILTGRLPHHKLKIENILEKIEEEEQKLLEGEDSLEL